MRFLFTILAALALAAGAQAADMRLPTKAPPQIGPYTSWSGIYLGGYADYSANFTDAFANITTGAGVDLSKTPRGPGIGGELEALYQIGLTPFVLGLRGDIGYLNLTQGASLTAGGVSILSLSASTNYLGAFNGEFGYAVSEDLLGYVVVGLGFGGAKANLTAAGLCVVGTCSQAASDTSVGWDIGAGLRYALTKDKRVSLKIEGDWFDLGSKALSIGNPPIVTSTTKYQIFRQLIGFDIKLGG